MENILTISNTQLDKILEECQNEISKYNLLEEDVHAFMDNASGILNEYLERLGEGCELTYKIKKHLDYLELKLSIKGPKYDPFEEGRLSEGLNEQRTMSSVMFNRNPAVTYRYFDGRNIISVRSEKKQIGKGFLRHPVVYATVAGLIAGLICNNLPEQTGDFIVQNITEPVLTVLLAVMSGIIGPIVFLSIVKAVSALDGIDMLTDLGSKAIKQFLITTLCIAVFTNIVGFIFFPLFGHNTRLDFDPRAILGVILNAIPTSFVTPFVENNIPQIVILGIGMGAVLLKIGDRVRGLTDLLYQLSDWLISFMKTILVIVPVIPFLSVFNIAAAGNIAVFLTGWKYIAATYVCMALCLVFKTCKVMYKCHVSLNVLWSKIKPVVKKVLPTGRPAEGAAKNYEISRTQLGIDPEFSRFWIPLSNSMLDPTTTISLVLATFLVAEITETPVTLSFTLILMLLAVELSMASPGLIAGYTVIFQSLGMSADYVGMFSAFSVVIKNIAASCTMIYRMLEHIEAAYKTDHIDLDVLRAPAEELERQSDLTIQSN